MAIKLVPYNNAMRLGQGFNSYTQEICVDDAVVIDPDRAENVVTNDGTTMRIIAERSALPSAWSRQPELIADTRALKATDNFKLQQYIDEEWRNVKEGEDLKNGESRENQAEAGQLVDGKGEYQTPTDDTREDEEPIDDIGEDDYPSDDDLNQENPDLADDKPTAKDGGASKERKTSSNTDANAPTDSDEWVPDVDPGEILMADEEEDPAQVGSMTGAENEAKEPIEEVDDDSASPAPETGKQPSGARGTPKSTERSSPVPAKPSVSKPIPKAVSQRAKERFEAEKAKKREEEQKQDKVRQEEKEQLRKAEAKRTAEQRAYEEEVAKEARMEERARRKDERDEQQQIRKEKREFDARRRADFRSAIEAASKTRSMDPEEMKTIAAKNQFVERFSGMLGNDHQYTFDNAGARGPSQTVTYTSRFVERLSDVTEDMCISGSLSIKAGKIGGSGKGSFVDSDKFKESDLNFYISVKVVNQTVNFKDALVYNPVSSVTKDNFKQVFGDSFISGFVEGGEFNAIVSMKILNKAKKTDIQAEAKVALTTGSINVDADANVGIARANLETNTETTIQVAWSGGGHIKPMEQQWNINSLMEAAARFPDLVADCPQRIYAVLTKYETLRSFLALKPKDCTPLQYENARIYTNALLDYYMSYKSMYKQLGEQMFRVDAGTLEIQPWIDSLAPKNERNKTGQSKGEKNEITGLYPYVEDPTRFDPTLDGLSDARDAIRRQMARIVNEVDLIENSPKYATDEDHKERFQTPVAFNKRVPKVDLPAGLRRFKLPLSGQAITNTKLTPEQQVEELRKEAELEGAPYLYTSADNLTAEEKKAFDIARDQIPGIGLKYRVTGTVGSKLKGKMFTALDYLQMPGEREVVSIKVHIFGGFVSYLEVGFNTDCFLATGVKHNTAKSFGFGPFRTGECVVSASIETGVRVTDTSASKTAEEPRVTDTRASKTAEEPRVTDTSASKTAEEPRVLAIGLFTNRGRSFLATALTEAVDNHQFRKDNVLFKEVKVAYFDRPVENGTFKGFFGSRDDITSDDSAIWRLGIIWGTAPATAKIDAEELPLGLSSIHSLKSDTHMPRGGRVGELSDWQIDKEYVVVRRDIKFDPEYYEPPLLISGIRHIDVKADRCITADAMHMSLTRTKATAILRADGEVTNEFDMSWLSVPMTDKHIEAGVYEFVGDEKKTENGDWVDWEVVVPFSKPFRNTPKDVNWLCNIVNTGKDNCWTASSSILDPTNEAMTIQSSRHSSSGTDLIGTRVGYFCYDESECTNIQSGSIDVKKDGKGAKEGRVKFNFAFKKAPVVFLAIRFFIAGVKQNLRITGDVRSVQDDGFDYFVGAWEQGSRDELREFSITWLAVE